MFTQPDGSPIHPERFSSWFKQHCQRSGLPPIRLHDVRHSYVTALLGEGVPLKVVSQRVGQSSPMVTMTIYQPLRRRPRGPALGGTRSSPIGRHSGGSTSYFCGIPIYLYYADENPPHFHARYGEHEAGSSLQRARYSADGFPADRPAWSASGRRNIETSSAAAGSGLLPARRQVASSL